MNLKESAKTLKRAASAFSKEVKAADARLVIARRDQLKAVQAAREASLKAGRGNKLESIGFVRSVTLYEDRIATPDGIRTLSPSVSATADQQGMKQVVQGWVFKSDQDRREVYLKIDGPDWSTVVPFKIQSSIAKPQDLHRFAASVNSAAKQSDRSKESIRLRKKVADRQLLARLEDRAAIEAATRELADSVATKTDLLDAADQLDGELDSSPEHTGRAARLVRSVTAAARSAVEDAVMRLETQEAALASETGKAIEEADRIEERVAEGDRKAAEGTRPRLTPTPPAEKQWEKWACPKCGREQVASYRRTCPACAYDRSQVASDNQAEPGQSADRANASAGEVHGADRLEQLERLRELRDILTEEEFEAEKARILSSE